jgi:hypothetical protein
VWVRAHTVRRQPPTVNTSNLASIQENPYPYLVDVVDRHHRDVRDAMRRDRTRLRNRFRRPSDPGTHIPADATPRWVKDVGWQWTWTKPVDVGGTPATMEGTWPTGVTEMPDGTVKLPGLGGQIMVRDDRSGEYIGAVEWDVYDDAPVTANKIPTGERIKAIRVRSVNVRFRSRRKGLASRLRAELETLHPGHLNPGSNVVSEHGEGLRDALRARNPARHRGFWCNDGTVDLTSPTPPDTRYPTEVAATWQAILRR